MTRILVKQLNYGPNAVQSNCERLLAECVEASAGDIVLFSRYAVCGYFNKAPLLSGSLLQLCNKHLESLASNIGDVCAIVGGLALQDGMLTEAIYLVSDGKYEKLIDLPISSYDATGKYVVLSLGGLRAALLLEEHTSHSNAQTWYRTCNNVPPDIDVLILLGRSPHGYCSLLSSDAAMSIMRNHSAFIYLNILGGYGSNVFIGGSLVYDGINATTLALWEEDSGIIEIEATNSIVTCADGVPRSHSKHILERNCIHNSSNGPSGNITLDASLPLQKRVTEGVLSTSKHVIHHPSITVLEPHTLDAHSQLHNLKVFSLAELKSKNVDRNMFVYQMLMLALRDYVKKSGFSGVLLGLSGGIDSALVAAIASDALGAEHVHTFMLTTRHTSQSSVDDAQRCAGLLGTHYKVVSIEGAFCTCIESLKTYIDTPTPNNALENMQSRIRGMFLMAISNATSLLLLATGNKSELLTGYMTLYGDTCGGYAPIKNIYKTDVYDLVKWRNSNIPTNSRCEKIHIIPNTIITKAPSAELKPNQTDQDTLPEYNKLDGILSLLVDRCATREDIVLSGYTEEEVDLVMDLVKKSAFKLDQIVPGPDICAKP
ncbi:NAD(+) synthase [Anaplasma phagocytophilum]|uniref:NAD(+) synthase n=1 Tax=Anaplasma phagocytophilum TaxID=948 RepID=UPI00201AB2B3